jgi:hypothetical protein
LPLSKKTVSPVFETLFIPFPAVVEFNAYGTLYN